MIASSVVCISVDTLFFCLFIYLLMIRVEQEQRGQGSANKYHPLITHDQLSCLSKLMSLAIYTLLDCNKGAIWNRLLSYLHSTQNFLNFQGQFKIPHFMVWIAR